MPSIGSATRWRCLPWMGLSRGWAYSLRIVGSFRERRRLGDSGIGSKNVPRSRSHDEARAAMRCYFLRNNRIEGVELLTPGPDEALIQQAKALFQASVDQKYDSFEVWEGKAPCLPVGGRR